MRKTNKTRITYGIALTAMAATLSALQAYADDYHPASTQPPVMSPPANSMSASPDTTKSLGTVYKSDLTTLSPSVPQPAQQTAPSFGDAPQPQQAGNITYITGGVGDEETSALDAAKKDYNLHIMSAMKDGSFVGDAQIVIRDRKGNSLLDTSAGPLFYAKLPAGTYAIELSENGQTKKQTVTIGGKGFTNLGFSW